MTRLTSLVSGRRLRAGLVVVLAPAVLTLSGCVSAYDLPLPGGAANHGSVYRVTAEFSDVLDLVPQSAVKVNEVTVGSVEKIEVTGWTARVTLRLPTSLKLPDNSVAELRQTSLLGEKYIQLEPPTTGATGQLADGDDIPLTDTSRNPEVEEVLSALSLLLNGGGVAQLKVINTELGNALSGNTGQIRDLIAQLNTFVGGLDQQKSQIVRALANVDKLAAELAKEKDSLATIIDEIALGLKVLADQRSQLTRLLKALSDLGAVGTKVIEGSRDDTLANLKALGPILANLTAAGDDLPKSLQLFLTYPFPDEATQVIRGDYTNLHISLDANLGDVLGNLSTAKATGGSASSAVPSWKSLFPTGAATGGRS